MKPPIWNQPGMRYSINDTARKHYEFVIPGMTQIQQTGIQPKPIMAFVLLACRINSCGSSELI